VLGLLIAIAAVFTVAGVWALGRGEVGLGVGALGMFGTALVFFVGVAIGRARTRRALDGSGTVEVAPVRIPQDRGRLAGLFLLTAVIGGTFLFAFHDRGALPLALGGIVAGGGVLGLGGVAVGRLGSGWIRFCPEGLEVGTPGLVYVVPWDDMLGAGLGELSHNPVVTLSLRSLDGLLASVRPPEKRASLAGKLAQSVEFVGFPLVVQPRAYGLEPAWLLKAIDRYARDRAARAELVDPARIGAT
jgi:hypothetical protein